MFSRPSRRVSPEGSATLSAAAKTATPDIGGTTASDCAIGKVMSGDPVLDETTDVAVDGQSSYALGTPCNKTSFIAAETAAQYASDDAVGSAYWCAHISEEARSMLRKLE